MGCRVGDPALERPVRCTKITGWPCAIVGEPTAGAGQPKFSAHDCTRSQGQIGNVEPAAFLPGAQAKLGHLHATRACQEIPWKRLVAGDVPQEEFPLDLEGIIKEHVIWHVDPVLTEAE